MKIVSSALENDGTPKDIVIPGINGLPIEKSLNQVYLSIPVINRKMEECRVELFYIEESSN